MERIKADQKRCAQETGDAVAQHLFDAIERTRADLAMVEFWACAVNGFSRPVPDYSPGEMSVWLPQEQGVKLAKVKAR